MSLVTIPYRFTCRGGTAAALSSANEVPLARELYVETDTGLMKLGDGSTHYNSLNYINQNPATPCFQYTVDTTTTDSDPGTGKLRFNNATQNSATKLYIDDAEALSSTDLSAFFTELAGSSATGILHLTGILGTFKVYKWTAIDDGTGYFKFTVTHLCSSGNFTNGQKVRAIFHPMPASSGGGGSTAWTLLNSWDFSVSGAVANIEASLAGYNEVLVIAYGVTLAASGYRGVQFSGDGGSTWATSYEFVVSTGVISTTALSFIALHTSASASARSAKGQGSLVTNFVTPFDTTQNLTGNGFFIPALGSGIKPNRIKVGGFTGSGTTTTNMTGGKVFIYAR